MPRSKPGEGSPILLVLLGDREKSGAGVVRAPKEDGHHSVMSAHVGEDYSTTNWPVVVKIQRGCSPDYVADRLEDLADSLREEEYGFWGGVPDQLPEHVERAAEEDARRLGIGEAGRPVQVIIERPDEEDVIYRIDIRGSEAAAKSPQEAEED
jgi:hypothetical protein